MRGRMKTTNRGLPTLIVTCLATSAMAQSDNNKQPPSELEEVIVSAQRRDERLQDVPISISVLSGEDLDRSRVQGLTETLNRVPGVAAPIGALGAPQVVIRGVTASGLLLAGASTAAYYLDTIPYGFVRSAIVPDADVYDLERVEVLRGPQGTLFGANAQSGVIRILTHDPVLDAFDFKARASTSNTEDGDWNYRGDMALNVPVVQDKLAIRAVAGYQDLSGWIDKGPNENANDVEISNLRLKVKAQPTENLSVVASSWFTDYDASAQALGDDNGNNSIFHDEPVETDSDAHSLRIDYAHSAFAIRSATSYLKYSIASDLDLRPVAFPTIQSARFASEVFSEEIAVSSVKDGAWRWSFGAVYRNVEDQFKRSFDIPLNPTDYSDLSESWALFGEVTRLFLDGELELTLGLRYFEDEQTTKENVSLTGNPAAPLISTSASFDAVTPRVVLTWHSSDAITFYTSYAEGFRSGLVQNPEVASAAPDFPPLDSDRLHNYEIGAKGRLVDGRISFDTAIFYLDWEKVQQNLDVLYNGVNLNALVNGKSASGPGFEFAITSAPAEGLTLGVNFSWNDLRFDDDVVSGGGTILFLKGERLGSSPEYTAGASADYAFPFSGSLEGQFSISGNYISANLGHCYVGTVRVECNADPIFVSRAAFSINSSESWTTTIFVDNANDERAATYRAFGVPDWNGRNVRPRTIGLQLDYDF